MARIYNYNRSRVHAHCGVRLVRLELDGRLIFEGEIRKAVKQGVVQFTAGVAK